MESPYGKEQKLDLQQSFSRDNEIQKTMNWNLDERKRMKENNW